MEHASIPLSYKIHVEESNGDESSNTQSTGWDEAERKSLQAIIAARQPFLDFVFHRNDTDGMQKRFQVSGEPMFDGHCRFVGYRGIGVELIGAIHLKNEAN